MDPKWWFRIRSSPQNSPGLIKFRNASSLPRRWCPQTNLRNLVKRMETPKIGGFPVKWMVYKGKPVKTLLKLMIWGYHYFWKDPNTVGMTFWAFFFLEFLGLTAYILRRFCCIKRALLHPRWRFTPKPTTDLKRGFVAGQFRISKPETGFKEKAGEAEKGNHNHPMKRIPMGRVHGIFTDP